MEIYLWPVLLIIWLVIFDSQIMGYFWRKRFDKLEILIDKFMEHQMSICDWKEESIIELHNIRIWYYENRHKMIDDKYILFFPTYKHLTTKNIFDNYFHGIYREKLIDYVKNFSYVNLDIERI